MSTAVQQLLKEIEQTSAQAPSIVGNSGPKANKFKQRVALNGVTHGLTGQNVFLEECEYPAYMDFGRQYIAELRPVGIRETQLAQKVIDLNWRLNTASAIENNLFHSARLASVRDNDPNSDRIVSMITKADAWSKDCAGPEAFAKLGRYEAHLARTMTRTTLEFERLQSLRLRRTGETFDAETCQALLWYERMFALYTGLAAERATVTVTPSDSVPSDPELLCKKPVQSEAAAFVTAASGFMEYALESGLLTPEHRKMFDQVAAASKLPAPPEDS